MVANGRINLGLGVVAFFLTLYFSWFNNTWPTSLFRSVIGFIIFFLLGYVLRFILYTLSTSNLASKEVASVDERRPAPGTINREVEEDSFQSIPLTSLHQNMDTERMMNTIRTWTKEDREG